jgi:hypothetical protein
MLLVSEKHSATLFRELKLEATGSSKTSVPIYQTTNYIPEAHHLDLTCLYPFSYNILNQNINLDLIPIT